MFKAVVMIIFFVAFLFILNWILGKKTKSFLNLLSKGAKLEFSTKPGLVSFLTVIIVAAITAVNLLVSEVKSIMLTVFALPTSEHDIFSMGILAVIVTAVSNFLFIALMRYLEIQEKKAQSPKSSVDV